MLSLLSLRRASFLNTVARSPSGKAKVCKTFIGGSIPPRASNFSFRQASQGRIAGVQTSLLARDRSVYNPRRSASFAL
jgi:hypothetical protein